MSRNQSKLFFYQQFSNVLHLLVKPEILKLKFEYFYWWLKAKKEKQLTNHHYEYFFTTHFGLSKDDYQGKKVLDIGCGPRGSLEWAEDADAYGLDPLATHYQKLGANKHRMKYTMGSSERVPFETAYFDFVSSFNSLDHVEDLSKSVQEIIRVTKPGGYFLLIADIHQNPTICEPSPFGWDITERFEKYFDLKKVNQYEGSKLYKSIRVNQAFDHQNTKERYGVLTALFQRNEA